MLVISDATESIDFSYGGYCLNWEQLRDEIPLTCIIHWNQRHFLAANEIKKRIKISAWSLTYGKKIIDKSSSGTDLQDLHDSSYSVLVPDSSSWLLNYSEDEFLKC